MKHTKYITALLLMLCVVLSSCKVTEYVPVEVEKVKTEYVTKKDSIYVHDSIDVSTVTKNDTVYITKYKYKQYTTIKTDTIIRVDSIPVIKVVDKIVEVNKIYKWLKALMFLGAGGILLMLGMLIYKFKLWKFLF